MLERRATRSHTSCLRLCCRWSVRETGYENTQPCLCSRCPLCKKEFTSASVRGAGTCQTPAGTLSFVSPPTSGPLGPPLNLSLYLHPSCHRLQGVTFPFYCFFSQHRLTFLNTGLICLSHSLGDMVHLLNMAQETIHTSTALPRCARPRLKHVHALCPSFPPGKVSLHQIMLSSPDNIPDL